MPPNNKRLLEIADAFCGAGGSTFGLRNAIEARGDVEANVYAINHWKTAIDVHTANNPDAIHHWVDLTKEPLGKLVPSGRLDAIWLSPSCTTHSYARNGRKIDDQMRAGAWVTQAAAELFRPRLIFVENVPPFTAWGPLDGTGHPIKNRRGETFRAWVAGIESLGYTISWQIINSADFGAPQTRERFFMAAVRGPRVTFSWPFPTHSEHGGNTLFGALEKWVGAEAILDRSIPNHSIVGRKKPLSAMTLRRSAQGARAYWGAFIPALATIDEAAAEGHAYETQRHKRLRARLRKLIAAENGVKTSKRIKDLRSSIHRSKISIERYDQLREDLRTWGVTAEGGIRVSSLIGANRTNNTMRSSTAPLAPATTATGGGLFVIDPAVQTLTLGQHGGAIARTSSDPFSTIAGKGAVSLVDVSLQTFTMGQQSNATARLETDPLATIAARGQISIFSALAVTLRNHMASKEISTPMPTVATARHHALAEAVIVKVSHSGEDDRCPRRINKPLQILTAKCNTALAEPTVTPGESADLSFESVLADIGDMRSDRLVVVDEKIGLFDIRFRMIQPEELQLAQGFPKDYNFANATRGEKTKMIGNAVEVKTATALWNAGLDCLIPRARSRSDKAA
jgi:DNA (cytosine-5)-methyltransferase 1